MKRNFLISLLLLLSLAIIAGCQPNNTFSSGQNEKKVETPSLMPSNGGAVIRIAVGGMLTPQEGLKYYRDFINYIGEKSGTHIQYIETENYSAITKGLGDSSIDAAFICSGPYVTGHNEFGLELLVAPVAYGQSVYYSYIIVNKNNRATSFKELRGKSFAFADPQSNTGRLVPEYILSRMNETPDSFFKKYDYTYAHDKSIKAVAEGSVDGAAVDSLIWDYLDSTNPVDTSRTKILLKSAPYGIPPFVVRPYLPAEIKQKIRDVMLNAHNDPAGREILKKMMIDKFVLTDDKAYDSVREMKLWLAKREDKRRK